MTDDGQSAASWSSCNAYPHRLAQRLRGSVARRSLLYNLIAMTSRRKPFVIAVILFSALLVHAEPVSALHPTDYVNDFAHVLNQGTVSKLDSICEQIDHEAHSQVAVVTVNSLDGSDIEGYAVDLYKKWGIGDKASNRGVLILLAVGDHKYRIEVGYGLEPILPDGKVGGFGREAVPLLRANDYNGAILLMTQRVAQVIAQDAGIQLRGASPKAPAEPVEEASPPSVGKIIFWLIIIVIILFSPLRRILFWSLLFGGMGGGRSRGGWGGGGWGGSGGFGGGGGFGGFGGGSSGGGGASGSW